MRFDIRDVELMNSDTLHLPFTGDKTLDLVPSDTNFLETVENFAEIERSCCFWIRPEQRLEWLVYTDVFRFSQAGRPFPCAPDGFRRRIGGVMLNNGYHTFSITGRKKRRFADKTICKQ